MTAEDLLDHDISSSFVWEDRYIKQLQTLADKDEMTEDIRWTSLKDAIKHLLKQTFYEYPSSSAPILHPAASLIPLHSQSLGGDTTSDSSSTRSPPHGGKMNGHTASANGGGSISGVGQYYDNGETTASSDPSFSLNDRFRSSDDPDNSGLGQDFSAVREADMQAFFPSKRQAPAEWKGSWGKRIDTEEELKAEQRTVFGMLDDFENQPPFTIQRLSELVLRPTEHHHTLPKYIGALKRLLSVTATRDAFPAHPGEGEGNDTSMDGDRQSDVEQLNGAVNSSHATRTSTASPTSTPLFSPIPFLMRSGDEGMPGAGPGPVQDDEESGSAETAANELTIPVRDVPAIELGGADRTTHEATEQARRAGKGVGGSKSVSDGVKKAEDASAQERSKGDDEPSAKPDSTEIAQNVPVSSALAEAIEKNVEGESAATSEPQAMATSEPLGVPPGPVDEVDQAGDKHGQLQPIEPGAVAGGARAFSSTTSATTTTTPTITTVPTSTTGDAQNVDSSDSNEMGGERALKRIRSERNLHAVDGSRQQE